MQGRGNACVFVGQKRRAAKLLARGACFDLPMVQKNEGPPVGAGGPSVDGRCRETLPHTTVTGRNIAFRPLCGKAFCAIRLT